MNYSVKCIRGEEIVISAVVPSDDVFRFVDKYSGEYLVKIYPLSDERSN